MNYGVDDTIVAVASPPGGAVRGVIRVSGPGTSSVPVPVFSPRRLRRDCTSCGVRRAYRASCGCPRRSALWRVTCTCGLSSRSYTRQPSAELHLIGSPPLLDAALHALCEQGARLAQPGEFTLRAFLAGRLDLTQAEAVLGVVDAENSRELHVALLQLAGGLSSRLTHLRGDLLDLLAHIEAGLDFVDDDIEFVREADIDDQLARMLASIHEILVQLTDRGDSTREPRVVLRGEPNVGKSSLLNALVGTEAAIVSPQAGTTRDYVSRAFQWDNVAGVLVDTPGYEETSPDEPLARAAQQAAAQQVRQAHLEILCLDATRPLNDRERQSLTEAAPSERIVAWTKADLATKREATVPDAVFTSSVTGEGVATLRSLVVRRVSGCSSADLGAVASTAVRCRAELARRGGPVAVRTAARGRSTAAKNWSRSSCATRSISSVRSSVRFIPTTFSTGFSAVSASASDDTPP